MDQMNQNLSGQKLGWEKDHLFCFYSSFCSTSVVVRRVLNTEMSVVEATLIAGDIELGLSI